MHKDAGKRCTECHLAWTTNSSSIIAELFRVLNMVKMLGKYLAYQISKFASCMLLVGIFLTNKLQTLSSLSIFE